jgi:hypothetical protein
MSGGLLICICGASFSLQHRLQPMSGWIKQTRRRRLKPTLQTKVRATKNA